MRKKDILVPLGILLFLVAVVGLGRALRKSADSYRAYQLELYQECIRDGKPRYEYRSSTILGGDNERNHSL